MQALISTPNSDTALFLSHSLCSFFALMNINKLKKEKKIVLIVDDSILILERMIPMLEEVNNIQFVVHAANYSEAVELLKKLSPDMVLLDINLPDKSGIELLRTIKEQYQEIKVFMITNQANDYYRDICKKLGADHFFDKSKDFNLIPELLSAEFN
jgi:DNA-binding NarL/FixJ family response regulator